MVLVCLVLVCLVLVWLGPAAAVGGRAGTTAAILENQMGSSPPATSCHRPWQEVGPQQVVAAWRVLKLPGLVVQLVLVPRVQRQLMKEVLVQPYFWLLLLPCTWPLRLQPFLAALSLVASLALAWVSGCFFL